MAKAPPTWRRIESALIELLREEGIELSQHAGDTSAHIYDIDGNETEIPLASFAQQLEERL